MSAEFRVIKRRYTGSHKIDYRTPNGSLEKKGENNKESKTVVDDKKHFISKVQMPVPIHRVQDFPSAPKMETFQGKKEEEKKNVK